jgi:hypothetical protein
VAQKKRKRLGELLVEAGLVDRMQLQSALGEQKRWGRPLGQILVDMSAVTEEEVVNVLSHQMKLPTIGLEGRPIGSEVLEKLEMQFCLDNGCLPFRYDAQRKFLDVAMADPTDPNLFDKIRVQTQSNIRPHLAGAGAIERAVRRAYLGENVIRESRPNVWMAPGEAVIDFDSGAGAEAEPEAEPEAEEEQSGLQPLAVNIGPGDSVPDRRRRTVALSSPFQAPPEVDEPKQSATSSKELAALREEIAHIRALLDRDERVLRKLMGLLIDKGTFTHEELSNRLRDD